MISDDYKIVIRADKRPRGEHKRRFNAPQIDEVAVVIVDNENTSRDIIVQRRRKGLQRIAETHRSYDALQYPLIFLHGEDGYHFNIKQIHPKKRHRNKQKKSLPRSSMEFYLSHSQHSPFIPTISGRYVRKNRSRTDALHKTESEETTHRRIHPPSRCDRK
ncbi:hypothetical protein EVAR_44501_1 [Eumeta japonica]|uniref:Helitron helicase-like domain-containing protein n=1 Tax=Eumeta variegata TaxID=151549 RepID=A0A4C1WN29_EUMVA|nr:hypothetical protein EVAR_44501_1 [Eumeta japonica]